MNKTWTEMEKQYIRENATVIKDAEVAAKLTEITGRKISIQSVRKQRQKLGILKASGRGFCKIRPIKTDTIMPASDEIKVYASE